MTRLRSLLHARRWLALLVVVAALAVRIAVPPEMMPGAGRDGPTLVLCSGHMAAMPGMAMPGMDMGKAAKPGAPDAGKSDAPCAFTGLLAAALDGAVLPAVPPMPRPAFVVAATPLASVVARPARLRPPLRGPPGPRAV